MIELFSQVWVGVYSRVEILLHVFTIPLFVFMAYGEMDLWDSGLRMGVWKEVA